MTGLIAVSGSVTARDAALIKAAVAGIVPELRDQFRAEIAPIRDENETLRAENKALAERVAILEAREISAPADIDMDAITAEIDSKVANSVAAAFVTLPVPQDGKSVDMAEVKALVDEAVSTLTPAEPIEPDMDGLKEHVEATVKSAVAALPVPKDGEPGQDGLGLANALIDRDGCLVVTFTDGSDKNLGMVVGKDGENGNDGHTFTLDDFDIEPVDERTIKMGFTYGEVKHSFELAIPAMIYRGVWREDGVYDRGDTATWGGSLWHCDKDGCTTKPDAGDWTLAAKRGRDGRDAK